MSIGLYPARGHAIAPLGRIPVPERDRALCWRGALAVATDPAEIRRHGIALALSPVEMVLLGLLVRQGRATHGEIERALEAAGACAATLDVIAHRIRRKFAAMGAIDPIERRRGWGMILRVEPDMHGSTGLWIGGGHGMSVLALRMRG
uniref:helix-turn-helix domain-containing protein n=1 Tax=Sphingomonas bacterium TaxID=1895847 RepID=UPI00263460C3|nr:helix-turn-helix domain-containing protein [Sphingomonas bacterium]